MSIIESMKTVQTHVRDHDQRLSPAVLGMMLIEQGRQAAQMSQRLRALGAGQASASWVEQWSQQARIVGEELMTVRATSETDSEALFADGMRVTDWFDQGIDKYQREHIAAVMELSAGFCQAVHERTSTELGTGRWEATDGLLLHKLADLQRLGRLVGAEARQQPKPTLPVTRPRPEQGPRL